MPSTNAAFEEHQAWLTQIYAQAARLSVGSDDDASTYQRMAASTAARSPFPSAPMTWAHPEEANFEHSFAGISLDSDDFEAPVYRSLGGLFSSGAGEVFAEEDEAPVYRSLDMSVAMSGARPAEAFSEQTLQQWPRCMPPLIKRQKAGYLA